MKNFPNVTSREIYDHIIIRQAPKVEEQYSIFNWKIIREMLLLNKYALMIEVLFLNLLMRYYLLILGYIILKGSHPKIATHATS